MRPRASVFYYKAEECLLCMCKTRNKRLHLLLVKTIFLQYMRSINELQSTVFLKQCKKELVIKIGFIVKLLHNSQILMHKTCKQIFKGHFIFSGFFFQNCIVLLFVLSFPIDFTIYFYILVLSKYLRNINWEVLQLVKLGKPCLPLNL